METVRNEGTNTWHLLGARGCGIDPSGISYEEILEGTWAEIRDHVDRDAGERC